jgi:hypothetical protein
MASILVVPLRLDALYLEHDRSVVDAMADFSRLPYFDGERDVHSEVANLSEEILSQPFADSNLYLRAGVHLHWALPDALTRGVHTREGTLDFPAVPNRWLVTRTGGGETAQWVVESDSLALPRAGQQVSGISYPHRDPAGDGSPPFRYLGRCMPLENWQSQGQQADGPYLPKLTAMGYGEPTFAAFYPNCHSVFGFHDPLNSPQGTQYETQRLRYEVIGWYSDGKQDYLGASIQRACQENKDNKGSDSTTQAQAIIGESGWEIFGATVKKKGFKKIYPDQPEQVQAVWDYLTDPATGWLKPEGTDPDRASTVSRKRRAKSQLDAGYADVQDEIEALLAHVAAEQLPEFMVCSAQLVGTPSSLQENPALSDAPVALTVGNTGTEALSAYLAHKLAKEPDSPSHPDCKSTFEDQLEALHLAAGLEGRRLDVGPKFLEARHTKGFSALPGGTIWTIRPQNAAAGAGGKAQTQVTLPDGLADLLNRLNLAQQAYDRALDEIESKRKQLFADWYKYMLCAYPPEDTRNDYPDLDGVRSFIKSHDMLPLKQVIASTGTLRLGRDKTTGTLRLGRDKTTGEIVGADAPNAAPHALAAQVARAINETLEATWSLDVKTLAASCDLTVDDIIDWDGICKKLSAAEGRLPRITQMWRALSQQAQALLVRTSAKENAPIPQADRKAIVSALNADWVHNPTLYRADAFQKVALPPEARYLLRQRDKEGGRWSDPQSVRFNRLLVEAVLPEIRKSVAYSLQRTAAPRYWRPNDPVLLMAGNVVRPSCRHGREGALECSILSLDAPIGERLDDMRKKIQTVAPEPDAWTQQPWNPFLLEWEVEVFPAQEGHNLDPERRAYAPDFVTSNYELAENAPDLSWRSGRTGIVRAANVYRGRSILTPHAGLKLETELQAYLSRQKQLVKYYEAKDIPADQRQVDRLAEQIDAFQAWYKDHALDVGNAAQDPVYTAIRAYAQLQQQSCLSQSLGGFHEALLQHKQTLQLPLADPLGFDDYRPFTAAVADAVQQGNRSAPQPLNDFNPIRSGAMRLLNLRLVDAFGRAVELDCGRVWTAEGMAGAGRALLALPPRLAQAARLNFRWLSANHGVVADGSRGDDVEMNAHPATTPVCGWVLPNNLDGSLMVYDQAGKALGSIVAPTPTASEAQWESAPGREPPIQVEEIANPHLKKVVQHVIKQGQGTLQDFITALDSALENIDPETFAHHQGLALLMGRPIAVVRASLSLEVRGLPAVNQDWSVFRQDLERDTRETDAFPAVQFPIRVGEHSQLNDGLVGYWLEGDTGSLTGPFVSPETDGPGTAQNGLLQTIEAPPKVLTMLLDPRGVVHATSGVLPTKVIRIPPDQYAAALAAIQITFLSTPILTSPVQIDATQRPQIDLPLPAEPGYAWSWLEKEAGVWSDAYQILPPNPQATFSGRQGIREGWLKLSVSKQPDASTDPQDSAGDPTGGNDERDT